MKIKDIVFEYKNNRYVIQFSNDNGTVTWFKFLETDVYHSTPGFKHWLESLIEDAAVR